MKASESDLLDRLIYITDALFFFYGEQLDRAVADEDPTAIARWARKEETMRRMLSQAQDLNGGRRLRLIE